MIRHLLAGIAALAITSGAAMAQDRSYESTTTRTTTDGAPMAEHHHSKTVHKVVHHHAGVFHDKTKVTRTSVRHDDNAHGVDRTTERHESTTIRKDQ